MVNFFKSRVENLLIFGVGEVEIWSLRHSPPLMLLPPTLWVALRGARSAADAATATLEHQSLGYASSFSSLHCCILLPRSYRLSFLVPRLSFIVTHFPPFRLVVSFLYFRWVWVHGVVFQGFSTSTPKVQRNVESFGFHFFCCWGAKFSTQTRP